MILIKKWKSNLRWIPRDPRGGGAWLVAILIFMRSPWSTLYQVSFDKKPKNKVSSIFLLVIIYLFYFFNINFFFGFFPSQESTSK